MGETKTSKLLARKRPALIPVADRVIRAHVLQGRSDRRWWDPLRTALRHRGCALYRALEDIRSKVPTAESMSVLRVFDALAWMEGAGRWKKQVAEGIAADIERGVSAG